MSTRQTSRVGIAAYVALSLAVVAGSIFAARLQWRTSPVAVGSAADRVAPGMAPAVVPTSIVPADEATNEPAVLTDRTAAAEALVDRLIALVSREPMDTDDDELTRIEEALEQEGEIAGALLAERIDSLRGTGASQQGRLLLVLRRLPGRAAEDRLIREARSGTADSSRALAIESLGARRSDRALAALARIAETDPDVPRRSLITAPRDPSDTSTELPDEVEFTPRMKAMVALASTREPRAAEVLTGVLKDGPDESLRMEAARNLEALREMPGTINALRTAATADPSAYVRLAALHALAPSIDRTLVPLLQGIAARDVDAGVRALASRLLGALTP